MCQRYHVKYRCGHIFPTALPCGNGTFVDLCNATTEHYTCKDDVDCADCAWKSPEKNKFLSEGKWKRKK